MGGGHAQFLTTEPDHQRYPSVQPPKHHVQPPMHQVQPSPPPSASTSPSHDFSFTISLHPPAADTDKPSPPPFTAIDLSPADEIFFHGHLLPLHLLSGHLPAVSPRSSTNSLDSFTLPIHDCSSAAIADKTSSIGDRRREGEGSGKSKPFSLFGIPRWRKTCPDGEKDHDDDRKTKSSKFDLFKRYVRLVKPFLSLRNKRGNSDEFLRRQQQPYSYSGNLRLRPKKKEVVRGRRGEFSAPASMITSPTNSGLLVASGSATPTSAARDSTMEELQAAIQAAIAHCKKSIGTEDKIIVP